MSANSVIRTNLQLKPKFQLVIVAVMSLTVITNAHLQKKISVTERALRGRAIKVVPPAYPKESQKGKATGVAVVQLDIDDKGEVTEVEVLEAPDSFIRTAVTDACRLWTFRPTTVQGESVHVRGKLTFYYVLDSKGARVENP